MLVQLPSQLLPFATLVLLLWIVSHKRPVLPLILWAIIGCLAAIIEYSLVAAGSGLALPLLILVPMYGLEHLLRSSWGQSEIFFSLSTIPFYPLLFESISQKRYWLLFLVMIPVAINIGIIFIILMFAGLDA
ncbi:hypothetical protein A2454_00860 [Candidatus Peribacteria bacterium RIFOXYC2_FULL_55_14]|nr:MAG: hypothetical protein UY85_C0026G0011 [Candidatus Peribacteria bacterium GW2011_GWB1_54_5]KKW42410.1 MAG: hypothetical protein UY90_C0038G0009 [Candidatus Peregrinibacteria bacterium GW2011_GWA2_54_9]OGJ71630.1 MAG: hypothetical protein A2198_05520 [Candidatus Peribacteria bacterium RIFOXYA1_FULL_56_14]OGJ73026.1 MAG: hypothetical protein A2217_07035 [Candidatus Peribacteria bacterium RIFOXYA2_FULL_55_28]OGJ74014.1 MAG: hypothetical protein A2384_05300 [Candidatus Peribacteria bacterium 